MLEQLKIRKQQCLPDLMGIHHSRLDFGSHFNDLCGVKIGTRIPIKKSSFATPGRDEFRRCVGYVSKLPHVAQMKERNLLEIDPEFADVIY